MQMRKEHLNLKKLRDVNMNDRLTLAETSLLSCCICGIEHVCQIGWFLPVITKNYCVTTGNSRVATNESDGPPDFGSRFPGSSKDDVARLNRSSLGSCIWTDERGQFINYTIVFRVDFGVT